MRLSARIASAILVTTLLPSAVRAAVPSSPAIASPAAPSDTNAPPAAGSQTGSKPAGPRRAVNTSATGISNNPKSNTTANYALISPSLPTSGPPQTGLFPGLGRTLLDDGIDIHGITLDHFLANPSAGNIIHQTYNLGVLAPAVDVNLGRLIGFEGGNIHVITTFFGVRSNIPTIARDVGGFIDGFQTTPAPSTTPFLLSVLTYEQKLLNDRLSIEFGRTNPYRYFLLPNSIDPFESYFSTYEVDGDFNSIPYPSWRAHATYHLKPSWYVQVGGFANNFYRAVYNNLNLGAEATSGAQILGELGYRTEFNTAAYPPTLKSATSSTPPATPTPSRRRARWRRRRTRRATIPAAASSSSKASRSCGAVAGSPTVRRRTSPCTGPPACPIPSRSRSTRTGPSASTSPAFFRDVPPTCWSSRRATSG